MYLFWHFRRAHDIKSGERGVRAAEDAFHDDVTPHPVLLAVTHSALRLLVYVGRQPRGVAHVTLQRVQHAHDPLHRHQMKTFTGLQFGNLKREGGCREEMRLVIMQNDIIMITLITAQIENRALETKREEASAKQRMQTGKT